MEAIIDRYGFKEGLSTKAGVITSWPYKLKKPGKIALAKIVKDYEATTAYKVKRKAEYPSIEDQLDMLYKDKVSGSNEWVKLITEIKTRHFKSHKIKTRPSKS